MLDEDIELKISTSEYLPKAYSLLIDRFRDSLDLKWSALLTCKATQRKTVYEFHEFILGAKETALSGLAHVHAKLMERHKPFVIYFDREDEFIWFDWALISRAGFANRKLYGETDIGVWSFKIAHGEELQARLNSEVQQDFWWND